MNGMLARLGGVLAILALGMPGVLAQGTPQAARPAEEGNIFSNLLKYGGTTVPPSRGPEPEAAYCPTVDVPEGGAAMQTLGGRGEGAAGSIRSQATLGQLARECAPQPDGTVRVKVGAEVRVLLGPGGVPGRFDVPITFQIRHDDKTVTTRQQRMTVTVAPGEAQGFASTVEDGLVVPAGMVQDYEIMAGIGKGGLPKPARDAAKPKPRRKAPAAAAQEGGESGAAQ